MTHSQCTSSWQYFALPLDGPPMKFWIRSLIFSSLTLACPGKDDSWIRYLILCNIWRDNCSFQLIVTFIFSWFASIRGCGLHRIFLATLCIALPILWFVFRHNDNIWILQDFLGICFWYERCSYESSNGLMLKCRELLQVNFFPPSASTLFRLCESQICKFVRYSWLFSSFMMCSLSSWLHISPR